jgi:hypothetical protein
MRVVAHANAWTQSYLAQSGDERWKKVRASRAAFAVPLGIKPRVVGTRNCLEGSCQGSTLCTDGSAVVRSPQPALRAAVDAIPFESLLARYAIHSVRTAAPTAATNAFTTTLRFGLGRQRSALRWAKAILRRHAKLCAPTAQPAGPSCVCSRTWPGNCGITHLYIRAWRGFDSSGQHASRTWMNSRRY